MLVCYKKQSARENIIDIETPVMYMGKDKLTWQTSTRGFKVLPNVIAEFKNFSKQHSQYIMRDLMAMSLIEYMKNTLTNNMEREVTMNNKDNKQFLNNIKSMKHIDTLSKCPCCGEIFLVTVETEKIEGDYLTNNHNRKCIVECSNCKKRFVSDFD